jgi:hypothetical protein
VYNEIVDRVAPEKRNPYRLPQYFKEIKLKEI